MEACPSEACVASVYMNVDWRKQLVTGRAYIAGESLAGALEAGELSFWVCSSEVPDGNWWPAANVPLRLMGKV